MKQVNIYRQDCPECAATSPAEAVRCPCGYVFAVEKLTPQEIADYEAQEAWVRRDYWEARVVQAEAALEAARADMESCPDDVNVAAKALLAEQAVHTARAEFNRQSAELKQPRSRTVPAPTPVVPAPRPAILAVKPAPIRFANMPETKAQPTRTMTVPIPVIQSEPTPAFRAAQTERAEQALRAQTPTMGTIGAVEEQPVVVKGPTADRLSNNCPNCTAPLAANSERCRCGFVLSTLFDMAPIKLDTSALDVLSG